MRRNQVAAHDGGEGLAGQHESNVVTTFRPIWGYLGMRFGSVPSLACLGLGAMLGFLAATRDITPLSRAGVTTPPARHAAAGTAGTGEGVDPSSCRSEGVARSVLLAQARAETKAGRAAPSASGKKPNIVFIMGDDVGWFNIGAYHRGMMAGKTPNLDRLASRGMLFTDYYAEPSCTAGRANFITGQFPIRTGLTTVGQAGAKVGMPAAAPTIATALRSMGYATGQFGKNHLGDLNEYLPTVHGFEEFYGYLYHLDAMEDPAFHSYPPELQAKIGPRNMIHSWATNQDDPTEQPRWGKVGKQRIEDAGTLFPERMKTVDDEILGHAFKFIDKSTQDNKPFFVWLNPTRMHVITHLSDKYAKMQTPENGWYTYEAGMAQLDDIVGSVTKKLEDSGSRTTRSSCSRPTTARRTSHGRTAARRRSPVARGRCSKGAWRYLASCSGRVRCRPGRSRISSCRGSTGFRRSWPWRATRRSSASSTTASSSVNGSTRSISTVTTRPT